jgi:hypothetical protein
MNVADGRGPRRQLSEINVTPFVDVMLVLLIIFMVTAPMMQQGIDVDLPNTTTQNLRVRNEPRKKSRASTRISPCLWFDGQAEEAAKYYTGIFKNSPTNSSDHIDNCDGDQAIWLFAVPEVALFQDNNSVDWDDPAPTHAFDAKFEIGKSYQLTVGLLGGRGENPPPRATCG